MSRSTKPFRISLPLKSFFLTVAFAALSSSLYSQDSIARVETVYLKWFNQDKFELNRDTIRLRNNSSIEYSSIPKTDGCEYFYGTLKNGKPYNGKIYFYDRHGVLLKVKVFKTGNYGK